MNRLTCVAMVFVAAFGSAVAAPAKTEADAKAAEEARSAHFKDIGKTWAPIAEMLKRKQPYDAAVVEKQAAEVAEKAKKIPALFEVDTRDFKDLKTEALDGIWTGQADFSAKAEAMSRAAQALSDASKDGGDAAAFPKNAAAVGKACSACHDTYRMKKAD